MAKVFALFAEKSNYFWFFPEKALILCCNYATMLVTVFLAKIGKKG
jgi:hypothetical protein